MTRKDYVQFAELLRTAKNRYGLNDSIHYLENGIIDILWADNPRFDVERFVKACVNEEENDG